jgi:HSP20 family molecular chaperone IbpA
LFITSRGGSSIDSSATSVACSARAVSSSEAANSSEITWLPVVDVHEEAERFVVRADLPGVDPKDVEITAEKAF